MRGPRHGDNAKILVYCQSSSRLGRLHQAMTIADSLVARHRKLSILVLTGSPLFGTLEPRARIDFVRIPSLAKLENGRRRSTGLHMNVATTVDLRRGIVERIAEIFDPDVFMADEDPLGIRDELEPALRRMKARATHLILGLRDVPDEPRSLRSRWRRNGSLSALEDLYDQILIYGLDAVHQPLSGLSPSPALLNKITYTGYLEPATSSQTATGSADHLLVTAGSGGDSAGLIDWVLRAYETRQDLSLPAKIILGPLMAARTRAAFRKRARPLGQVGLHDHDGDLNRLIGEARAVICQGGYNTFCRILAQDKPALIVPPKTGGRGRRLRAERAQALGLARELTLPMTGAGDPDVMAEALAALPEQAPPSTTAVPGLQDGLEGLNGLITPWLTARRSSRTTRRNASSEGRSRKAWAEESVRLLH